MTIDELLCKFQGKCWHEWEWNIPEEGIPPYVCLLCGYRAKDASRLDYADDHTAMELLRWFQEEKWEMWNRFEDFCHDKWGFQDGGYDIFVKEWNSISIYLKWLHKLIPADSKPYMRWVVLLSEWLRLEEVGEKWGWEECKRDCENICPSYDEEKYGACSGKIRSAWAREEG